MFNIHLSTLAIFAVVPVLGFLIFIHELGHFLAAKWMGVRVLEFGFGYPPRMAKLFTRNGVEYTLNWLPFGGFVRMAGEDGDDDDPQALPNVVAWRRIIVMLAGPFMNLLTAVVIFAILMMAGVPTLKAGVNPESFPVQIEAVAPDSPAQQAGLKPGDIIVAVNGENVMGIQSLVKKINENAGAEVTLSLQRGDETLTARLRPRLPEEIPAGQGATGIQISPHLPADAVEVVHYDPVRALAGGVKQTWDTTVLMIAGLVELFRGWISPSAPSPEGGVGGLVAIGRITAEVAKEGWRNLFNLAAFLSINLGILNLLPIPALDGGRILFALAEIVSRRRIPPEKEALVHMAGFIILVGLMIIVTFMDISNWIAGKPPIPGG
ncbi:MAG: RIP metalloprotease RseP [Clostridia bacterium]|nr:MAG: RIP metalloprotease RseP [Clostridia bacterium]